MRLSSQFKDKTALRLLAFGTALGVALIVAFLSDSRPSASKKAAGSAPPPTPSAASANSSATKAYVDAAPRADEASGIRDITPPGVIRVYRADQFATTEPDNLNHFANVRVVSADGLIQADLVPLRLYGLILPPRNKICRTQEGRPWACGLRAYVALYNLVTGHPIACEFKGSNVPALGVCRVDSNDITAKLLREGWASLAEGVTDKLYVEAVAVAKAAHAGIWSSDPPQTQ